MNRVLIAGCSFAGIVNRKSELRWVTPGVINKQSDPLPSIDTERFQFFGDDAAGNRAIAARVKHQLFRDKYNHVVVMWTGINRVDVPIERKTHVRTPNNYQYVSVLENWAWYFSGGICGSWQFDSECPAMVKSQFRDQYLHQTFRSATDTTLAAILETQELLDSRKINYTMCFIYDIHQSYDDVVDKVTNTRQRSLGFDRWPQWLALEHCLGKIDPTSSLYSMINWNKFTAPIPPYEYCLAKNLLQIDEFHPTISGMVEWFDTQMGFNITI